MFSIIAEAEAKFMARNFKVHFHEVGAVDSIVDIVCVALAINKLSPRAIYSRSIPLGSGKVNTMHGVIPVPAPATVEILTGCLFMAEDLIMKSRLQPEQLLLKHLQIILKTYLK